MDYEAILTQAHQAAYDAVKDLKEELNHLNCGFAWVTVDGREPLARYCRKKMKPDQWNQRDRYGSKGYPSGWQWWAPGRALVQDMDIKIVGCRAFQQVLAEHGIRAQVNSRLD